MTGGQIAATAVGGTLAAGALGAGIYASTRHGQRTIGRVEERVGRAFSGAAKDFDKRTKVGEEIDRQAGVGEDEIRQTKKRRNRVSEAARNLGDQMRRSGKMRQSQNRNPSKVKGVAFSPAGTGSAIVHKGGGSDAPIDAEFHTVGSGSIQRRKNKTWAPDRKKLSGDS